MKKDLTLSSLPDGIKSDCELLEERVVDVLDDIGSCFETVLDENKNKIGLVGDVLRLGMSMTKLTLKVGGCAIKYTPKAVVAVAQAKRELVNAIEDGYREIEKERMEAKMNEKIKRLKIR
jgi:hypothetical protein